MSGKPIVKNELIEELMEAVAIQSNFAEGIDSVLESLNHNEKLDHDNDKIRNEAIKFLLSALEAYNAKDYEGMQKYTHAAVQKMHEQATIDFKDDKPRADVRIQLSVVRCKTVSNKERIAKLISKLGEKCKR